MTITVEELRHETHVESDWVGWNANGIVISYAARCSCGGIGLTGESADDAVASLIHKGLSA